MNEIDPIATLFRWLHIVPAIVAGGAAGFAALALGPGLASLPAEAAAAAREAVVARWKPWLMGSIGLLLLSGFVNYLVFQAPHREGQSLYHALFGVKFLMALAVFFLASALAGKSAGLARFRANGRFWTLVNALLVLGIVLVSGVMKNLPRPV